VGLGEIGESMDLAALKLERYCPAGNAITTTPLATISVRGIYFNKHCSRIVNRHLHRCEVYFNKNYLVFRPTQEETFHTLNFAPSKGKDKGIKISCQGVIKKTMLYPSLLNGAKYFLVEPIWDNKNKCFLLDLTKAVART